MRLIESYSESNYVASGWAIYGTGKYGMSFKCDREILDSAKFHLYSVGSPTGNAYAYVYKITAVNGVPTTEPIATSDALDVSTLTETPTLTTLTFSGENRITFEDSYYAITMAYPTGAVPNYIRAGYGTTNLDTDSMRRVSFAAGGENWNTSTGQFVCFYVYADTLTVGAKYPLPAFSS